MKRNKIISNKVNILNVNENFVGQRVDNFLFNRLKNVPKGRVYAMLRGGEVRVNKKRVKPLYKLQLNDLIRIPPFWAEEKPVIKPGRNLTSLLIDNVIFEDDKVLVVNKPSGVASHGGSGINFGVIETLRSARSDLKNLELVHRLDLETSGCLILAKKKSALRQLHRLIRDGKIIKKYILLVKGKWDKGEAVIDLPLLKNQLSSGERVVKVNNEGKRSVTIFRPLKVGPEFSLLEAELKTGRTHQIRVHAKHIGYPIAGDDKYGDKEFNSKMRNLGLKRMFLHASEISFEWDNGESAHFVSKLDESLKLLQV